MEYNPNANIDDSSCVTLIMPITGCYWCDLAANYFDFNYQNTVSSMTVPLVMYLV